MTQELQTGLEKPEFVSFHKIARFFRDVIITEKLDGTNAQVLITDDGLVLAGSRKRFVTPDNDHYGFAAWVEDHKDEILSLGPGRHLGEWWGRGINRGYGIQDKRFSLFNTVRWCLFDAEPGQIKTEDPRVVKYQQKLPPCIGLVPVLYQGIISTDVVNSCLSDLRSHGSYAAPGFGRPEGVVVYHTAANIAFKVTLERDDEPKGIRKRNG